MQRELRDLGDIVVIEPPAQSQHRPDSLQKDRSPFGFERARGGHYDGKLLIA